MLGRATRPPPGTVRTDARADASLCGRSRGTCWTISLILPAVPPRRRPLAFRLGHALGAAVFAVAAFDLVGVFWVVRFREIWYFGQHFSKWEKR